MGKHDQAQLMAAVYPSHEQAKTVLDMLQRMHKATTITLKDAAIVTKNADGKVKLEETAELTTREGAVRGAIVTGVLGLIYPPSLIVSLLAGGVLGGLIGKIRDTGIKNAQLKEVADRLAPGKSAVIALGEGEWVDEIQGALAGYEGMLIIHPLTEEEAKQIYLEAERAK
jgi:uncharacterized membrane protein